MRSARRRKRRPAWETLMELRCWDMNVSTYPHAKHTYTPCTPGSDDSVGRSGEGKNEVVVAVRWEVEHPWTHTRAVGVE